MPIPRQQLHPVWNHFATLCTIPRPSKQEAALREHLLAWAGGQGLESEVDGAGNLILRKPATPGVVLQGHLDRAAGLFAVVTRHTPPPCQLHRPTPASKSDPGCTGWGERSEPPIT